MIGSPFHGISMSQPNENNFQPFQQTQANNQQQMQASPCNVYPKNLQGQHMQGVSAPFFQSEGPMMSQQSYNSYTPLSTNPYAAASFLQNSCNPASPVQTQNLNQGATQAASTCAATLPQSIIEQIRACIGSAAPIFILSGGCQQSIPPAQSQALPQPLPPQSIQQLQQQQQQQQTSGVSPGMVQSAACQPSFFPYPLSMTACDSFAGQPRHKDLPHHCLCCSKTNVESKCCAPSCCSTATAQEEHRCVESSDETICCKRNCPSAVNLQALASQLLSVQGIISCAATRLVLRRIPGSNITTSMEDTMDRALKSIGALNKEQLIAESRNAQQVNALISLHMTANPPSNIVPVLTQIQLKVNVLKAQVENLIAKKIMENQGAEVERTDRLDATVLAAKTDAELRQLVALLRQKECDERVNLYYAPYRSQRAIAECRLSNVQRHIRQVEEEFERRRCSALPSAGISMCSRAFPQICESPKYLSRERDCIPQSPNPFAIRLKCPRQLRLEAHVGSPQTTYDRKIEAAANSVETKRKEEEEVNSNNCRCSDETCSSSSSSSSSSSDESDGNDENVAGEKKKLGLKIDEAGKVKVTSLAPLKDVSLMKLTPNVTLTGITRRSTEASSTRKRKAAQKVEFVGTWSDGKVAPEAATEQSASIPEIHEDEDASKRYGEQVLHIAPQDIHLRSSEAREDEKEKVAVAEYSMNVQPKGKITFKTVKNLMLLRKGESNERQDSDTFSQMIVAIEDDSQEAARHGQESTLDEGETKEEQIVSMFSQVHYDREREIAETLERTLTYDSLRNDRGKIVGKYREMKELCRTTAIAVAKCSFTVIGRCCEGERDVMQSKKELEHTFDASTTATPYWLIPKRPFSWTIDLKTSRGWKTKSSSEGAEENSSASTCEEKELKKSPLLLSTMLSSILSTIVSGIALYRSIFRNILQDLKRSARAFGRVTKRRLTNVTPLRKRSQSKISWRRYTVRRCKLRSSRHSISEDRNNGRIYVLRGSSFRKRTNLDPLAACKVQRNLLIRSRPKNSHVHKENLPPPFVVLKRIRQKNDEAFRKGLREAEKVQTKVQRNSVASLVEGQISSPGYTLLREEKEILEKGQKSSVSKAT